MKCFSYIFLTAALILGLYAARASAEETNAVARKFVEPGTLSAEAIANLKIEYSDTNTHKKWVWVGAFTNGTMTAKDKEKAKVSKKIPFRIIGIDSHP